VPDKPEVVTKLNPSTGASTNTPCLVGATELLTGASESPEPQAVRKDTVISKGRVYKFFIGISFCKVFLY
jgi:hypothetical protein